MPRHYHYATPLFSRRYSADADAAFVWLRQRYVRFTRAMPRRVACLRRRERQRGYSVEC